MYQDSKAHSYSKHNIYMRENRDRINAHRRQNYAIRRYLESKAGRTLGIDPDLGEEVYTGPMSAYVLSLTNLMAYIRYVKFRYKKRKTVAERIQIQ